MVEKTKEKSLNLEKASLDQVIKELHVDTKVGLPTAEVQSRLEKYGANELVTKEK